MVLGVILLFIGVTLSPVITAFDNNKSIDNFVLVKTSDNYKEIITIIRGYAEINWIERRGYFRGEVNLTWDGYHPYGFINLSGYRHSEEGIEYYNVIVMGFVYAYRFICFSSGYSYGWMAPGIVGIAIGNIEWS